MASNYDLYSPYAIQAAQKYGVPQNLFLWQIGQESGWDPTAKNPGSTATGLGQFIRSTAKAFGIDPTNPYQSLDAAAKYDAQLYNQTGNWNSAMQAYGTATGGVTVPSNLIPDRPDANTSGNPLFDFSGKIVDLSSAQQALSDIGTLFNYGPGLTTNALGDTVAKPGGLFSTITEYLKNYAIVILGIVIVGLSIWGLMRRT